MTNNHFSPRIISLLAAALTIIFVNYACGAPAAEAPADSAAEPVATFPAPPESTQPVMAPETTSTQASIPPPLTPQVLPTQISAPPAIPESRRLTLEYPPKMKAGAESDVIRLTLEVDEQGNVTSTAQVEGNIVTGETVTVPNLYETHFVTAEARIDMAGMEIQPPGVVLEPMTPGQPVKFFWSIRPQETGLYRGTVWLHLVFVDRVSGEESQMAVSAQVVEIEAVDFFGLPVNAARTSGVIGSVVGGIVGFPFLEDILKFFFRRRRKR